jgi:hypothetical protein
MPRVRIRPLFPAALSIEEARVSMGLSRRYLLGRIARGELEAYQGPPSANRVVRILVADLVAHVRTWKRYRGRKSND